MTELALKPSSHSPMTVLFRGCARLPQAATLIEKTFRETPGVTSGIVANSATELISLAKTTDDAVVLLCLSIKEELIEVVTMIQALAPRAREGKLRILVFNALEITKVHTLLASKGAQDVLPFSLSRPGLIKKLQYNVMLLKNGKPAADPKGSRTPKNQKDSPAASAAAGGAASVTWTPALQGACDCWILRKNHVKSVLGNWFLELTGPGPASGSWRSVDPNSKQEERLWEWEPRPGTNDRLIGENGQWQLHSKQPEFQWKTNRYKIIAKNPELRFVCAGSETRWRFRTTPEGGMQIAENSQGALDKVPLIQQSFDTSIVIRQDKEEKPGANFMMKDDGSSPDWGQGDLKDDSPKGAGIGMGQGGKKAGYDYEDPRFSPGSRLEKPRGHKTGADAFEQTQLKVLIYLNHDPTKTPLSSDILEQTGDRLQLDAPARVGKAGDLLLADFVTLGKATTKIRIEFRIDTIEEFDDGRSYLCGTIQSGNVKAMQSMVSDFVERQHEILRFLEEAKGC